MAKDKDYQRLIHTRRWLQLRKQVLSDHPLCQCCEAAGLATPATEVHHITPVEEAVNYAEKIRLMYDPGNLRALCHSCHVQEHTKMGRGGKEANRERQQRKIKKIVKKFYE